MSFDLSGNYTLPAGNPVVAGTLITAAQFNATMTDLATALSQVILADGRKAFSGTIVAPLFQGPVTGNVTGNLTGNVTGTTASFSGGVTAGSFSGALTGNVTGTTGTFSGGVTAASLSGNLSGTSATLSGAMTAATVSLSGGGLTLQGNQLSNLSLASTPGQAVPYQQLFSQGVPLDIAAAATLNIGAQNTAFLRMTGTGTAITSFGTAYNGPRFITVVGAGNSLTNSASLETHTGANVTLGAGDTFVVVPKATTSGTPDGWRVVGYQAYGTVAPTATQAAVQAQTYTAFTTGGSGTTYTLTPVPALTAYAENQEFDVEFHTASSGTPTINVSGLGARDLQWYNSVGVLGSAGAGIPAGFRSRVTYDGAVFIVRDRPPVITSTGPGLSIASGVISAVGSSGRRQCILSGPVNSVTGYSQFGGSLGSTTVTASGTIVVSAAQGLNDRTGTAINPSWAGLSGVSTTYYLYLEVAADGTCTAGAVTTMPVMTYTANYSTTAGLHTFSIPEMTTKLGDGSSANPVWRVFVGEAATGGGGTVTSLTWYQVLAYYASAAATLTPSLNNNVNHNIGVPGIFLDSQVIIVPKTTVENSFNPLTSTTPDMLELRGEGNVRVSYVNNTLVKIGMSNSISVVPSSGGAPAALTTPTNWWWFVVVRRAF
jgi:hypothetical protein